MIIKKPNPWDIAGKWGLPPMGDGALWGSAPFRWGTTAKPEEIDELRRVIAKWKPAATSCRFIELVLRTNIFGIPTHTIRLPVHEPWEQQSNGAYREFYNYSYSQERV